MIRTFDTSDLTPNTDKDPNGCDFFTSKFQPFVAFVGRSDDSKYGKCYDQQCY